MCFRALLAASRERVSLALLTVVAILISDLRIYFSARPSMAPPHIRPNCGGKRRPRDPFLMCDACETAIDVNAEPLRDLAYASCVA
jgi:hypothetical protein